MTIDPNVSAARIQNMVAKYTATVIDGRLVLDAPTDLPEGIKVDLNVEWSEDQLPEAEREALWASIDRGAEQIARGEFSTAEEVLARLDEAAGA